MDWAWYNRWDGSENLPAVRERVRAMGDMQEEIDRLRAKKDRLRCERDLAYKQGRADERAAIIQLLPRWFPTRLLLNALYHRIKRR